MHRGVRAHRSTLVTVLALLPINYNFGTIDVTVPAGGSLRVVLDVPASSSGDALLNADATLSASAITVEFSWDEARSQKAATASFCRFDPSLIIPFSRRSRRRSRSGSRRSFPSPTPPQIEGWPHIVAGDHTLICAPTGSGKTLAAFLCVDRPAGHHAAARGAHAPHAVLYISPLRALAFDVEKNLRAPLVGIGLAAERIGVAVHRTRRGDAHRRHRRPTSARS